MWPLWYSVVSFYGCNFKCPFCFAQKYSYSGYGLEIDSNHKIALTTEEFANYLIEFIKVNRNICYIQLTGGEPIKSLKELTETTEALLKANEFLKRGNILIRVMYQTNGYFLGSLKAIPSKLLELKNLTNIAVVFEISLKGTNPREFVLLTGTKNEEGFYNQIRAYWLLKEAFKIYSNINVVARLAIGHHRKTIHFYDFEKQESFFKRKNWAKEFEDVFIDNTLKISQAKMVCECINAEGDGVLIIMYIDLYPLLSD